MLLARAAEAVAMAPANRPVDLLAEQMTELHRQVVKEPGRPQLAGYGVRGRSRASR